ncbi:MAG: CpsB/CapC family capsule biosynthesis tyrosine phosphatase [Cetobacterium sp.]
MIDLHSHILHEVDDGSRSLEESLEMIKSAIKIGFKGIVCTSHYKAPGYLNKDYWQKFQELKLAIQKQMLNIEIYPGNEMFISVEELKDLEKKKINTYNGTSYILVELDAMMPYMAAKSALEKIIKLGYKPIIAHMERNKKLKISEMMELKKMGIPFQMNIASIDNGHSELAKKLLESRLISFLTSDAHRSDKRNYSLESQLDIIKNYLLKFYGVTEGNAEFKRMVKNAEYLIHGKTIDIGKTPESLISVVTPMYNDEKYIGETIESVQNQSYTDWEMIIIDDGSSDNSVNVIKKYVVKDSRIKLIEHESNKGVANARNTGLQVAKGKYVAFLDSNDTWTPDKLKKQKKFMEKNRCKISFTGYFNCDKDMNIHKTVEIPEKLDYKSALGGNKMGCLTVIIDREAIPNLRMKNIHHEDYATWLGLLRHGYLAYGLNEPLAKYRVLETSISSNKKNAMIWHWNVYRKSEKMGVLKSTYYFIKYAFHGVLKKYID